VDTDADGEGPRARAMCTARVHDDLEELADAAVRLLGGQVTYEDALASYFPRLLDAYGGDRGLVTSFENVHVGYL
jgi:hypothetical protein